MVYVCPKDAGHQSEDADYCSVCGTKIGAAPLIAPPPLPPAAGAEVCPDCGLTRNSGARFCEVCRYDFEAHTSASPASAAPAPMPAPDPPASAPVSVPIAIPAPMSVRAWEAIVTVDPSLYTDPDPDKPCPVGEPERTFPLDLPENLIGRRSDRRDIHPEVPLSDTGVSHRHAKILRRSDGGLVLLDVGSTNGTQLNGQEVSAGVQTPLTDGDQITLGCWTRITLRAS